MGREHAPEEWLPGGVATKDPVASEIHWAEFTLDGGPSADAGNEAGAINGTVGSTVDLNEIDFEGLIALGISVGQAARFISQRERRGGIADVAEIDGFYGLDPGVRDILRWRGHA